MSARANDSTIDVCHGNGSLPLVIYVSLLPPLMCYDNGISSVQTLEIVPQHMPCHLKLVGALKHVKCTHYLPWIS